MLGGGAELPDRPVPNPRRKGLPAFGEKKTRSKMRGAQTEQTPNHQPSSLTLRDTVFGGAIISAGEPTVRDCACVFMQ